MFSQRFRMPVVITAHARERMVARGMDDALVLDIVDMGVDKDAGRGHHWLYKELPDRTDNALCVAALVDNVLVVKTVMHHWELRP